VFPQYVIGVGDRYFVSEIGDSETIDPLLFVSHHPYLSWLFCHRSLFEGRRFRRHDHTAGRAYEDWQFNADLLADGCRFAVAPRAAHFYRQHRGSLMADAAARDFPVLPHPSRLLLPETMLRLAVTRPPERAAPVVDASRGLVERYLGDPINRELIRAANLIDPVVAAPSIAAGTTYSCKGMIPKVGRVYRRLCEYIGGRHYDDILLVPFMAPGGAEKYIAQVMRALIETGLSSGVLVIAMQAHQQPHANLDQLPAEATFLDAFRVAEALPQADLFLCIMKLIDCFPEARLHVKPAESTLAFFASYRRQLSGRRNILYHFCNDAVVWNGFRHRLAFLPQFIQSNLDALSLVVSDHQKVLDEQFVHVPVGLRPPAVSIPACCPLEPVQGRAQTAGRILWASRLDSQKRPGLLPLIAGKLGISLPEVHIDVFGSSVFGSFDATAWADLQNLHYRGPFARFADVAPAGYDLLLYTSHFDGCPNVILEALAHGLPVVAPDLGGIPEVVHHELTGLLVEDDADDGRIAAAYARTIVRAYREDGLLQRLSAAGRDLVLTHRSREAFHERVVDAFAQL